jgi:broad specificity phosphatase PhoE
MADRMTAAVRRHDEQVAREHGAEALWVAVSHGDLIKAVLADAAGTGLERFQRFTADPASVSAVRYGGRHTFVLATNDLAPDVGRFRPPPPPDTGGTEDGTPSHGDAVVGGGAG